MNDRRTVQTVLIILGVIAVCGLVGIEILLMFAMMWHLDLVKVAAAMVPLVGITTGAAGAIGGLLANTRSFDVDKLNQLAEQEKEPNRDITIS